MTHLDGVPGGAERRRVKHTRRFRSNQKKANGVPWSGVLVGDFSRGKNRVGQSGTPRPTLCFFHIRSPGIRSVKYSFPMALRQSVRVRSVSGTPRSPQAQAPGNSDSSWAPTGSPSRTSTLQNLNPRVTPGEFISLPVWSTVWPVVCEVNFCKYFSSGWLGWVLGGGQTYHTQTVLR